jgi:peroxiredoxin
VTRPAVGDSASSALADAPVICIDGESRPLGSWWADGPALVVFIRHFGCIGCSVHIHDLAPRLDELANLGLRTVIVGNGDKQNLATFVERNLLEDKPADIVTDPSLASFEAAGLERSFLGTFGPRALYETLRAFGKGHLQRPWVGPVTQQAGTLLIDGEGRIAWLHRSRSLTGHAPAVEIVDQALALAMSSRRGT